MTDEVWETIEDFPNYEISSLGNVFNTHLRCYMRTSRTQHGHRKVSIWDAAGIRRTMSVSGLVANAFVRPPNYLCNYVILLDGDLDNVTVDNIVWRPRHFAWKYSHQLRVLQPIHFQNLTVVNVVTDVVYGSIVKAGMAEGLLFQDIWRSTYTGSSCFPLGSVFEVKR